MQENILQWGTVADTSDPFQQKARDLHQAAVNLYMAAKSGDANATHQAAIAVGKACGACHDEFRSQ
jgi:cytochrome c556